MINVDEFTKRLSSIMEYYDLSAALLADKIDVQRSSISHLLSGRNKPSLEFVLKILKAFPEVELYWLLNGVGTFPKKVAFNSNEKAPTLFSEEEKAIKELKEVKKNQPNESTSSKAIERIVVFFTDGTFKNYIS
jgi:transcriptional regulator with XRE-family HTH domain